MTTAHVFQNGDSQMVRLPVGFEFETSEVVIRREGDAVIFEPMKSRAWTKDFFEQIRILDPAFSRPDQGTMPDAPKIEPAS
jgi:virulence-associated protein VagC